MNIHMDIDLSPGSSSAVGASQAPDLVRERQTVLPGLPAQSAGDDAASELRSTYHDSFGGSGGFTAPLKRYQRAGQQVQLVRPVPPQSREPQHTMMADNTRISSLEDRLINQERASQNILDRAMRIKEDVIENLNITHSTWQGEKRQRELLQEHIRSITELVRKMDKDIKVLEEQIRIKDSYLAGSGNAIKSLEIQQATSLTDMRGRIARCDAAIAKLALDVQKCQDGQSGASGNQQVSYQRLQDKIQALEIKVAESTQKIERNNTESLIKAQSKENNMARDSAVLETKLKSSVEELKLLMNSQKQANDAERERSISRITVDSEKQQGLVKERLEKLELRVDLALEKLDGQVRGLRSSTDVKDVQRQQVDMERRVTEMVNNLTLQQNEAFLKLKKECRQGFSTVHDSITNSKHVLEGKLTLSEEQLRKEIGHVKKMVVLV